jgi:cellulose biosynthesis protein BcsQ
MGGSVVTFYSYKGGVGRSFAVANVAVILAQWGYRVLAVDWDIEAPGLSHYFAPHLGALPAGVLEFVTDCKEKRSRHWRDYAHPVQVPDCGDNVFLMPASAGDGKDYTSTVQVLDWDALYGQYELGSKLETLRAEWTDNFDFVLVDSRTGLTDFSGLTTAQLPDILAFLFTASHQSLNGCCDIARRAMEARRKLPIDRPAIVPLPIVAKFEQREEYDRAQEWRKRFGDRLTEFFRVWAPSSIETSRLVDLLTIPYVPRWTFGEELAAVLEPRISEGPRTTSSPMSYPLETIAAVLANRFGKIELLCSSRDEYVMTARATARLPASKQQRAFRVFISYNSADRSIAAEIEDILRNRGLDTFFDQRSIRAGDQFETVITEALEQANALIVIASNAWVRSKGNNAELDHFLRSSLRSEARKPIVPLLLPGSLSSLTGTKLADFAGVNINPALPLESQLEPVFRRLSGNSPEPSDESKSDWVYVCHRSDDLDFAQTVVRALRSHGVEAVLPPLEGEPAEIEALHRQLLAQCKSLVLCWATASEVWVRATSHAIRNWREIGRSEPFDWRCLIVGPPPTMRKSDLISFPPSSEIDVILDLTATELTSLEAFAPLIALSDRDAIPKNI